MAILASCIASFGRSVASGIATFGVASKRSFIDKSHLQTSYLDFLCSPASP
jgi:hypothetical protein